MTDKALCIFHSNCQDGFAAAWVVRHALGDNVEFYPGVYDKPPPSVLGRNVILVDFSYKRAVLQEMACQSNSLLVLDHHKSARDDLADFGEAPPWEVWREAAHNGSLSTHARIRVRFDMERSGAGLAWDYFNPGEPRPLLIDRVEDRDLWRFSHPQTRSVCAAMAARAYDFEAWDEFMKPMNYPGLVLEGSAIERKHHQDILNLLPTTERRMLIGGRMMPVANLPPTLTSDAAHKMAEEADGIAACYIDTPAGRVFSLRSIDGGPDCQAIAKDYGGGGHVHAAGFTMPIGWEGEFGATGEFPDGKISEDDEGELRIGVTVDEANDLVMVMLGKPVGWFGLPRQLAIEFATSILTKAGVTVDISIGEEEVEPPMDRGPA